MAQKFFQKIFKIFANSFDNTKNMATFNIFLFTLRLKPLQYLYKKNHERFFLDTIQNDSILHIKNCSSLIIILFMLIKLVCNIEK